MTNNKSKEKILPGGLIDKPGSSRDYKTGSWRNQRPVWNKAKCIHCGLCVNYCPENCIPFQGGKRDRTNFDYCKGCGVCANICPVKAIEMERENI